MTTKIEAPRVLLQASAAPPRIGTLAAGLLVACGAAGIALAVLGLAGAFPPAVDGLVLLILGAGLVVAGGVLRNAYALAVIPAAPGVHTQTAGFVAELILGLVAAVLGIATLAGGSPLYFPAFGVMALGLGLWMGSADVEQFDRAVPRIGTLARRAIDESAGVDVLFGILAVALGILSWLGVAPRPLALVGDVGVGIALLLIGMVLRPRASRRGWSR
jgi:hypothetical protein